MHEHGLTTPTPDQDETAQFPEHLIRQVESLDPEQAKEELQHVIDAIDSAEEEADQGTDDKTSSE